MNVTKWLGNLRFSNKFRLLALLSLLPVALLLYFLVQEIDKIWTFPDRSKKEPSIPRLPPN